MSANVYDLPADFPERLRTLREECYLTQADLAERAGLTARSIHELESGRRKRALAKTIMLTAEALEVTVGDLLNGVEEHDEAGDETPEQAVGEAVGEKPETSPAQTGTKRPPGFPRWAPRLAAAAAVLAAVGVAVIMSGGSDVAGVLGVDQEASVITMRDPGSGQVRWRREFSDRIRVVHPSPAGANALLVGLAGESYDGGGLVALDTRDGSDLWSARPDLAMAGRVYGAESVAGGGFACEEVLTADLRGDGIPEIVAYFHHSRWFPAAVCIITADGRLESTYYNRGHLYGIIAADLDGDGRDEIVCAGTNNALKYNGPTVFVLDDVHRTGAAVDPETSPGCTVADSSLVRIVIPNLPADVLAGIDPGCRAQAQNPGTHLQKGAVGLQMDVGCAAVGMYVIALDADLRPLTIGISDALRTRYAQAGVDDTAWRRSWVNAHLRFEYGLQVASPRLPD